MSKDIGRYRNYREREARDRERYIGREREGG